MNKDLLQKYLITRLSRSLKAIAQDRAQDEQIFKFVSNIVRENRQVQDVLSYIMTCVANYKLSKEQHIHFARTISDVPALNELLMSLRKQLTLHNKLNLVENIILGLDLQEVHDSTLAFLNANYTQIDLRRQIDSRPIRRVDSLARLLALHPRYSVCTAASFHADKLIIAANITHESERFNITNFLKARLLLIHDFVKQSRNKDLAFIKTNSEEWYARLMEHGGTSIPKRVIIQAIEKLIHAVCLDDRLDDFPLIQIFQKQRLEYDILLPVLSQQNYPGVQVVSATDTTVTCSIHSDLECAQINLIHAEQLIAWRVFHHLKAINDYSAAAPLLIGTSKLCCITCEENLQEFPVQVRGCHEQRYQGTYSVLRPEPRLVHSTTTPPRMAATAPHNSDEKSIEPINRYRVFSGIDLSSVCRKLDFSDQMPGSGPL